MAVDGVEQPREAKAQDGTGKERWEHDLLLPGHVLRLTDEEPDGDHDERHEPCIIGTTEKTNSVVETTATTTVLQPFNPGYPGWAGALTKERLKPGFHYPSSRSRVHGPSWRPVNLGAFFDTRVDGRDDSCQIMHPSWRPGSGNRALLEQPLDFYEPDVLPAT